MDKNHDLGHTHWKRSAKKAENRPILDPKCARFPGENANLTNGTHAAI